MFSRSTLQSLIVLLLLALFARQSLLALVAALLLFTAGVAGLWNRWSLARVSYERELSQTHAFPDEVVELVIRLANRKPLPLASIVVREIQPRGVELAGPEIVLDPMGRQMLLRSTSMRWYEGVTWRYQVRCLGRGSFRFGPTHLEAGDPFGFYHSVCDVEASTTLIVYPRLLPLDELRLPARHPLGPLRARQLIRDPLRTVGVRDYHPDDPLKDVHWSATARAGRLQTRIYEPTTSQELAIVIDLDTFERYWEGIDDVQVERMISAAATVAQAGLREGYAVGLYVNGSPPQFEQLVRIPPSRSPAQHQRIMEMLARLTPYSVTPVARVLRMVAADLNWGASLVLISVIAPEATRAVLAHLHERGRGVAWLYLGAQPPARLPGVVLHHAPPQQDWRSRRVGTTVPEMERSL